MLRHKRGADLLQLHQRLHKRRQLALLLARQQRGLRDGLRQGGQQEGALRLGCCACCPHLWVMRGSWHKHSGYMPAQPAAVWGGRCVKQERGSPATTQGLRR